MERKSLVGLSFILLILVAARVHAEEYLDQAEDAEEYLVQAEDAEESLIQAEDAEESLIQAEGKAHCWVRLYRPCLHNDRKCNRRCKLAGHLRGRCRPDNWCWCRRRHCAN